MFGFIRKIFIEILSGIGSFGELLASNSETPMKCVSLNNELCQTRPTIVNINSDETLFCPFSINVNMGGGSFNTIDNPYAQVCVPNKFKNLNVKVFNLISGVNETRFLVQHESRE